MIKDDYSHYEEIQKFKKLHNEKQINFAKVFAIYKYDTSFIGIIKKIIFCLFIKIKFTKANNNSSWVLAYSRKQKKRKDYDMQIDFLLNKFPGKFNYIEITEEFSFLRPMKIIFSYFANDCSTENLKIDAINKFCWELLYIKAKEDYKTLEHSLGSDKFLMTFCDAMPHENILTQIAKKQGKKTFTLQHGQYRILNKNNISPDAEVYENFISDYMLVWGQATIDEFAKYGIDKSRLIVSGRIGYVPETNIKSNIKNIGILLNGSNGMKNNIEMINIVKDLCETDKIKYSIKLHPDNDANAIFKLTDKNCAFIGREDNATFFSRSKLLIGNMSGIILEALSANLSVATYVRNSPDVFKKLNYVFSDVIELRKLYYQNISKNKDIQYFLSSIDQKTVINDLIRKYV